MAMQLRAVTPLWCRERVPEQPEQQVSRVRVGGKAKANVRYVPYCQLAQQDCPASEGAAGCGHDLWVRHRGILIVTALAN